MAISNSINLFAMANNCLPWNRVVQKRAYFCKWVISPLFLVIFAPSSGFLHAAKPSDPEVQEMVQAGIQFLHQPIALKGLAHMSHSYEQGATMLAAYAIFKVEFDAKDLIVSKGVKIARAMATTEQHKVRSKFYANYELAVAILLLAEVGPEKHQEELEQLGFMLFSHQKSHGGFGYAAQKTGDISQTQYAMLAVWTLSKLGFEVPSRVPNGIVNYLARTQDPSGGWPYRGRVSPQVGQWIPQDQQVISLTMGAAGSLLMSGEIFGFWSSTEARKPRVSGIPPAFRDIEEEEGEKTARGGLSAEKILEAAERANKWLENPSAGKRQRDYYRRYTQERYESFLEFATGDIEEEPEWYNSGVADLKKKQSKTGAWGIKDAFRSGGLHNDEPGIATSFAILFLIRSTKKSLGQLSEGFARGGYELPKDTTQIRIVDNQIKGAPISGAISDLLYLLEDEDADDLDGKSIPDDLKLAIEPKERRKQLDRLIRLVRGSKSWQARRVAARLLGQSGESRMVPALIYALSDPDVPTKRFARDGLRFISRRFDGFGMSDKPTPQEARNAQAQWRKWYLSIDPGYKFLSSDL